jgi:hypothetical protein
MSRTLADVMVDAEATISMAGHLVDEDGQFGLFAEMVGVAVELIRLLLQIALLPYRLAWDLLAPR